MMRLTTTLLTVALSSAAAAEEFTPQFYAGVLGGIGPTTTEGADLWNDDSIILSPGIFAGVNLTRGSLVYGLEAGISTGFGKTNLGEVSSVNTERDYPRYLGGRTCYGCTPLPEGTFYSEIPGGMASNAFLLYAYEETIARPTVSARVGIKAGEWTLFGRAGLGAVLQRQTTVVDGTTSISCSSTLVETTRTVSGGYMSEEQYAVGCLGPQEGDITKDSIDYWSAAFVYGLGAEYDFEQYFARGEVEMTHIVDGEATVRANLGFGIRF